MLKHYRERQNNSEKTPTYRTSNTKILETVTQPSRVVSSRPILGQWFWVRMVHWA